MSRVELVQKLFSYALDAGASEPEAQNAACRAIQVARSAGIKASDLFNSRRGLGPRPCTVTEYRRPDPWAFRFTVGKYRDRTIRDVMAADAAYCRWMYQNATSLDPLFRQALAECLGVPR